MEPNEMLKLVLLVLLLHFYSDFNLQIGAKLDGMKQKIWWRRQFKKLKMDEVDAKHYGYDFKCALLIHAFVWSILTFAPLIYFTKSVAGILVMVAANALIHAKIDDVKANEYLPNLIEDQVMHIVQIAGTLFLWYRCTQC